MIEKTSKSYSKPFLFLLILLFCLPTLADDKDGKDKEKKKKKDNEVEYASIPLFNGISVGYDLMGPIYKAYADDYMSNEFFVDVNLKNRFFPVIELGYGNSNKWGDQGINYKAKAPYMRIGMDYNFFYKKKNRNNILSIGLRYAFTSFDYNVASKPLEDGVWGDEITNPGIWDPIWEGSIPMPPSKFKGNMHWLEFVASARTKIFYNFHMSWSLRVRTKLTAKTSDEANPWYVPGFGIYKSMRFGINYSIIYTIPFGKKKNK